MNEISTADANEQSVCLYVSEQSLLAGRIRALQCPTEALPSGFPDHSPA